MEARRSKASACIDRHALWVSQEALVAKRHYEAILEVTGDDTIRTTTPDIARQIKWPPDFTERVCRNTFTQRWPAREDELQQCIAVEVPKYRRAFAEGDPDNTGVWFVGCRSDPRN